MRECLLNLGSDPVGMSPFTAGQFVEQALGAIGLVITTDFVELLTTVADELAGFTDVIELFGERWQAEFATCYFLVGGHTVTPDNTVGVPFCYPV